MSKYTNAAICLNGHIMSDSCADNENLINEYCPQGGEKVIIACQFCESKIRGFDREESVTKWHLDKAPAYCYNCGKAYPWTVLKLKEAEKWIEEAKQLSSEEKAMFRECLPNVMADSPQTQFSSFKIKKYLAKISPEVHEGLKNALSEIATEAAKIFIFSG